MSQQINGSTTVTAFFEGRASQYQNASERWPWSWLRAKERATVLSCLGSVHQETVLDFGCGTGYFSRLIASAGAAKVVGVDISKAMVAQLPADGVEGIVGDITQIDLGQKFSKIVCAGVLEFLPDPVSALTNARGHLAPGGRLVVLLPLQSILGRLYQLYHRSHGLHIHLFHLYELEQIAHQADLQISKSVFVLPFSWVATFEAVDK